MEQRTVLRDAATKDAPTKSRMEEQRESKENVGDTKDALIKLYLYTNLVAMKDVPPSKSLLYRCDMTEVFIHRFELTRV